MERLPGTTAAMEYKLSTDSDYTAVTGTEITGLESGTYNIRYAAKAGFNAGTAANILVPVGLKANQGTPTTTGAAVKVVPETNSERKNTRQSHSYSKGITGNGVSTRQLIMT